MGLSLSLGFPPNTGPAAGGIKPGIPLAAVTLSATAGTSASLIGVHPFDSMTLAGTGAVATNVLGVHTFGSSAGIGATGALAAALRADGPRSLPTVTLAATGTITATPAAFVPSDIAGLALWLDASDSATLYQDAAGTTPAVSDADPVGLWQDKSGNNYHLTQDTADNRPTLSITAPGRTIKYDGVDDYMVWTGNGLTLLQAKSYIYLFVAWAPNHTAGAEKRAFIFSIGTSTTTPRLYLREGGTAKRVKVSVRRLDTDTFRTIESDTDHDGNMMIVSVLAEPGAGTVTIRQSMNQVASGSYVSSGATSDTASLNARMGEQDSSTSPGNYGEVLIYTPSAPMSIDDIAVIESYLDSKWSPFV